LQHGKLALLHIGKSGASDGCSPARSDSWTTVSRAMAIFGRKA
jgi:hypothetical protein